MAVSDNAQGEGLVRVIGTGALGLNVINMVVGAGIFVLPGLVAAELGSAAIFAYLICSVTVALVFLCFAEVGSRVSRSGGAYAYVEEAFGPFAGFIASTVNAPVPTEKNPLYDPTKKSKQQKATSKN